MRTRRLGEAEVGEIGLGCMSLSHAYGEPTPPEAGSWHHVAYVFDGDNGFTGVATLYVDGLEVATNSVSPNIRTPVSSWLGTVDGFVNFYSGDIDELRIWHIARSPAGILEDMQGTVTDDTGLELYLNFDAIVDGDVVPDLSGNGNDATLGGGAAAAMPTLVPSDVPPTP